MRFRDDIRFVISLCVPQNVLRELEQKKPQLDELVHTAENLRADTNRQQLHGKGKYFPTYAAHLQSHLTTLEIKTSSKATKILFQCSLDDKRARMSALPFIAACWLDNRQSKLRKCQYSPVFGLLSIE